MSIEAIRAVVLFAIGDPALRARFADGSEDALAAFGLSEDERLALATVTFSPEGITFTDGEPLEELLGAAVNDGFPGFGGGWFGTPGGFGGLGGV